MNFSTSDPTITIIKTEVIIFSVENYGILLLGIVLNYLYEAKKGLSMQHKVMKKCAPLRDYESSYDKCMEEITHLQRLLAIEELKLFELMQTKKR